MTQNVVFSVFKPVTLSSTETISNTTETKK